MKVYRDSNLENLMEKSKVHRRKKEDCTYYSGQILLYLHLKLTFITEHKVISVYTKIS